MALLRSGCMWLDPWGFRRHPPTQTYVAHEEALLAMSTGRVPYRSFGLGSFLLSRLARPPTVAFPALQALLS
eukprot:13953022-Alexandrium_andersonii.AAC.1